VVEGPQRIGLWRERVCVLLDSLADRVIRSNVGDPLRMVKVRETRNRVRRLKRNVCRHLVILKLTTSEASAVVAAGRVSRAKSAQLVSLGTWVG
jgi:hypothetical protein